MLSSTLAILVTVGIVLSLVFETGRFFEAVSDQRVPVRHGVEPADRAARGSGGSSGAFGAVPVFAGTLLITAIAMAVAVPIGLLSAIYMTFYASARARDVAKPLLEILAGVPTVVYGFFAALDGRARHPRPRRRRSGLSVASESALAAGLVMGIMIIPFISSLSDDAITAVPLALRDGSFGLGATRSETIRRVIMPAALPGIIGGFLLAVSRAIGETMIVVMAAGLAANLTANPARRGHDGDGADRHAADGRSGVRQRQDALGLRARARALHRDARAQRHRAARSCSATGRNMTETRARGQRRLGARWRCRDAAPRAAPSRPSAASGSPGLVAIGLALARASRCCS